MHLLPVLPPELLVQEPVLLVQAPVLELTVLPVLLLEPVLLPESARRMERTTNPSDELPVYAQIAAVIAATNSPSSTVGSAGAATGAGAAAGASP